MSIVNDLATEVRDRLYNAICVQYDLKFKRFAFIVKHVPMYRYELPTSITDKTSLNYGIMKVYIKKVLNDPYDIDYEVVWKINLKSFIRFINEFINENYHKKFDFAKYEYQRMIFKELSVIINEKYQINVKINKQGEYLEFSNKVSLEPEKRIVFRLTTNGERDLIFLIKESEFPPEGLTILKQNLNAYMKSHKKLIREEIEEIASNTIEEFGGTLIPFTMYTINY